MIDLKKSTVVGCILLGLYSSEANPSTCFRETASHSHFIREKDVILASAHADIVLNHDLQRLNNDINDLCHVTDLIQTNSTLTPLIEHRFIDLC